MTSPLPCARALLGCASLVVVFTHVAARAETPYRLIRSQEYVWLGGGAALWTGSLVAVAQVDPLSPAEIARLDPADIDSFDRERMEPYREDHAGDALAVTSYLLPLCFFAREDTRRDVRTLAVLWVETTLWNQAFISIAKAAALRTRPYAYDPRAPEEVKRERDARLSFYSGHAASAAANGFFTAKVFSDYTDSRTLEIALWSGAVLYPAVTAFLRVDSGHHFPTDVMTGYAVGAVAGCLVPFLHRRDDSRLSLAPVSIDGVPGVAASFSF
jgi:membrane-associated phospholipid phosphatase